MEYICEYSRIYFFFWTGLCISVFCLDHDVWTNVEPHPRTSLRTQEPQHRSNCKIDADYLQYNLFHCIMHRVNGLSTIKMSVSELYPW